MERKKGTIKYADIFSAYVVAIPILQYYTLSQSSLNVATILAFVFLALFSIQIIYRGKYRVEHLAFPMRIYVLFVGLNFLVTSYIYKYAFTWKNISPTFRLVFLFFSLIAVGSQWFDVKKAFSVMEKILLASAFFIILHAVLYSMAHIKVTPIIESLVTKDSLNLNLNRARTGGFYMEPAHYAQSALLYICYKIFPLSKEKTVFDRKLIFIILGLIFSGSGQGYALLAVIYCIWVFYSMVISKASVKKFMLVSISLLLVIILLIGLAQIPYVQNAIERIISTDSGVSSLGGQALAGRSYTNHYFAEFPMSVRMTGVGFGHLLDVTKGGFTNSLYSHLIQCGYPSIVFLAVILVYYFYKGPVALRVHVIVYAIMITFTGMASPMMLCFFTSFYIGLCKENEIIQKTRSISE